METTASQTRITVEDLERVGGQRWQKGEMDRVYFNLPELTRFLGVEVTYYNSGNVSYATQHGQKISNSRARELLIELDGGKFWFDVPKANFYGRGLSPARVNELAEAARRAARGQ